MKKNQLEITVLSKTSLFEYNIDVALRIEAVETMQGVPFHQSVYISGGKGGVARLQYQKAGFVLVHVDKAEKKKIFFNLVYNSIRYAIKEKLFPLYISLLIKTQLKPEVILESILHALQPLLKDEWSFDEKKYEIYFLVAKKQDKEIIQNGIIAWKNKMELQLE